MAYKEALTWELKRLRAEQEKTRQDEVFGGLSSVERAAYDLKSDRINILETEIRTNEADYDETSKAAKGRQRLEWNKQAETDTSQAEARQPYRAREEDSDNPSTKRATGTSAKKAQKSK